MTNKKYKNQNIKEAKFAIGQLVKHRFLNFRGLIFDVDPEFDSSEDWYLSIPKDMRPKKEQPFYHLFAENEQSSYVAYVSEQNLLPDKPGKPLKHPEIEELFIRHTNGEYEVKQLYKN